MSDPVYAAGQALLNTALHEGLAAKDAEIHALRMAQIMTSRPPVGNDDLELDIKVLQRKLSDSRMAVRSLEAEYAKNQKTIAEYVTALAERDACTLEWMHSQEVFKRLSRLYGGKLGMTDDKRQEDFDHHILSIADEDIRFKNTELAKEKRKKAELGVTDDQRKQDFAPQVVDIAKEDPK